MNSAVASTVDYERRASFHDKAAQEYEADASRARAVGLARTADVYAQYAAEERAAARKEREWGNREGGDVSGADAQRTE